MSFVTNFLSYQKNARLCRSALKPILWHSLSAPRPPAPRSAPAQAFSGMSADRSTPRLPLRPIPRFLTGPLHFRSALTCAECWWFLNAERGYVNLRHRWMSEMLGVSGLWVADLTRSPLCGLWAPLRAPAQSFSGMSAHRSSPAYPILCPLRSVFRSADAPLTCSAIHPNSRTPQFCGFSAILMRTRLVLLYNQIRRCRLLQAP